MKKEKKTVVWFCGLPEKARLEVFSDLNLPSGPSWSWVSGHLPPPPDIELHIVCGDRHVKEDISRKWCGATVHLMKVHRGGPYLLYEGWAPVFVRKARELNADVVHGWGTETAFALSAMHAAPDRCVIGIQGVLCEYLPVMKKTIKTMLCAFNEWRVLRKAKLCVAESHYSEKTASKYTPAQFSIVPHPLREEFRQAALGLRDEKIMVFLGSLNQRKGFFDAIRAFHALDTDWKLICIGAAATASDQKEIDGFMNKVGAGKNIELVGFQDTQQIIKWLQRSPIFLLPSYMDTGPTALKEALAMGLFPVCYDNTGPKELIGTYGAGELVPTGDVRALTESLGRVIREQPWLDQGKMNKVADTIRMDLSPSLVWEKLDNVYNTIIQK